MDAIALFAIGVFALAGYGYWRTDSAEPLVRLFFALLMLLATAAGILGLALRWFTAP